MEKKLERILHVDDEPDIREVTQIALQAIGGFTVESCASGIEALEKAPTFAPDLLLLDVMMPGLDGPQTLAALRELPETAATSVVFMTAKVQAAEIERFKALGAVDVVTKPFDPATLGDQLRRIWEEQHG